MRKFLAVTCLALLTTLLCGAQIVNRLHVDDETFQRYAYGRMQQFHPDNLVLADSLYSVGTAKDNFKYKCLALSLEIPVRYSLGEYDRMTEAAQEIKGYLAKRKDLREFYYSTLHEYCEYLVHSGRMSDAMLEARAMERLASSEQQAIGRMYAYRIVGLIQSYRDNSYLAIRNMEKAAQYCKEAREEQELPNLHILMAQEFIKMKRFQEAEDYCSQAEAYQDFFPSIGLKAQMTRAYLYNAKEDWDSFWECYDALQANPLYKLQTDSDTRYGLDICFLLSKARFQEALSKADSLSVARDRYEKRHNIYVAEGRYRPAYWELRNLMNEKDSIYIKVQNEDLAILDAEMENAQLRQETEHLKLQNQNTILMGFILMCMAAFVAILMSQWRLRENLDALKKNNSQMLTARRMYQTALDSKEAENALKVKILQNRKSNVSSL